MMEIIRKSDKVAAVPQRWHEQYKDNIDRGDRWDKKPITEALLKLSPGFTADEVDAIIGNDSWTRFECDECGQDNDILVRVGQVPDYDVRYLDLCKGCIGKLVAHIVKGERDG